MRWFGLLARGDTQGMVGAFCCGFSSTGWCGCEHISEQGVFLN